jgi:putative phosphoesterase
MSKIGLISDVHGDADALALAWGHLQALGIESVVCAGDVVGYGPCPDRVVAFLKEHKIPCVRGNHDRWALERGLGRRDEFGGGTPSAETLEYLRTLPFDLPLAGDGRTGIVVHGSPRSDMEFVSLPRYPSARLRQNLEELRVDLLIVGHTHQPMWYRCDRGLVVNPGAVISVSGRTKTSRTFAVVDLAALSVTFHDVATGREVVVSPWGDNDGDPTW